MLLCAEPIHSPNVPFEYFGAREDEGDTPLERRQQMSPDLSEYDGGRKPSRVLLDSGVCTTVPFCRVSINPPKKAQDEDHVDYAGVRVGYTGVYKVMWRYTGVYKIILELCGGIIEHVGVLEYARVVWGYTRVMWRYTGVYKIIL